MHELFADPAGSCAAPSPDSEVYRDNPVRPRTLRKAPHAPPRVVRSARKRARAGRVGTHFPDSTWTAAAVRPRGADGVALSGSQDAKGVPAEQCRRTKPESARHVVTGALRHVYGAHPRRGDPSGGEARRRFYAAARAVTSSPPDMCDAGASLYRLSPYKHHLLGLAVAPQYRTYLAMI